jgi:hypothetical protein
MIESAIKDLIVLVPDNDVKFGIDSLLSRIESLKIRPISFEIFVHPEHDPGVYHKATDILRPLAKLYHYALVLFDHAGSGQEKIPSYQLAEKLKDQIEKNGWQDRVEIIIFDPELEVWVWSESPHVARALGWDDYLLLKNWLIEKGYWQNKYIKPKRPKEALELSLREKRIPRSSSIYKEIALKISLEKCQDQSFKKFKEILIKWFSKM